MYNYSSSNNDLSRSYTSEVMTLWRYTNTFIIIIIYYYYYDNLFNWYTGCGLVT